MTQPQPIDVAEAAAPAAPEPAAPALAFDLDDADMAALADIAHVAIELIDVMETETETLRAFRVAEAGETIARKQQLADLYVLKNQALGARLGRRALPLSEAMRDAMLRLSERMRDAAQRNALAIKAAQDANQMFIDAVRHSLRQQAQPVSTYGRNGRQPAPNAYQQRSVPVYSDRRL
jgi:flagellar biosynthesis/type III secretory pathway chaperone